MIIKKFVERDSRTAMAKVRSEFGSEAVVLSSRSLDEDYFEIVAAINYDEQDVMQMFDEKSQSEKVVLAPKRSEDLAEAETVSESLIPSKPSIPTNPSEAQTAPIAPRVGSAALPEAPPPIELNYSTQGLSLNQYDFASWDFSEQLQAQSAEPKSEPEKQPKLEPVREPELSVVAPKKQKTVSKKSKQLSEDDGPTLAALHSELASLKKLIKQELPKFNQRVKNSNARNLSILKERLANMGMSPSFVNQLTSSLKNTDNLRSSWKYLVDELSKKLDQDSESLIETGGVAAFVGPKGSGKTSVIAKVAASHLMAHGRGALGIVSTGGNRKSAGRRLAKFAQAMNIPYVEVETATGLKCALDEFSDKQLVLIDTPGMDGSDLRLTMQLAEFRLANHPIKSYLVVSADSGRKNIERAINAYSRYDTAGLVVTKIDQVSVLGDVLEALIRKNTKLSYISDGTRITSNLHEGGAQIVIEKALAAAGKARQLGSKNTGNGYMRPKTDGTGSRKLRKVVG